MSRNFIGIIPGLLFFVLGNLLLSLFISWNQWKLAKTQIKELGLQQAEFIKVKLFAETFHYVFGGANLPHQASLHVSEKLIFIMPLAGDWYSGLYRLNMPIVFSKNPNLIKAHTKINNIYEPLSILPGKDESLEIIYKKISDFSAKTSLIIDFRTKQDFEKVCSLLLAMQA
jgi:hypothetical protein